MHHQKFKHPKEDEPEPQIEVSNEKSQEIAEKILAEPVAKKAKLDETQESEKQVKSKYCQSLKI